MLLAWLWLRLWLWQACDGRRDSIHDIGRIIPKQPVQLIHLAAAQHTQTETHRVNCGTIQKARGTALAESLENSIYSRSSKYSTVQYSTVLGLCMPTVSPMV